LETEALAHNPEIAAAEETLKKAHAGLSAARAEYIPEIGAFAQYVHQDGVPLLTENNGEAGLKMNWTLLDFGKRSGQVHECQTQVAEAEAGLFQAEMERSTARAELQRTVGRK
jgi:outer membrane protein TolC